MKEQENPSVLKKTVEEVKTEKVKPANPDVVVESSVEAPIALYTNLEGYPYTAKYFEVKGIWDNPDIGLKDDILTIEQAYKKQVAMGKVKDSTETYKKFIKKAEKATQTEDAPASTKIPKIASWVKFMEELDYADIQ